MPKAQPAVAIEAKTETKEKKIRMTVYITKSVVKEFKHVSIDEEKDLSVLTENAIVAFLEPYRHKAS